MEARSKNPLLYMGVTAKFSDEFKVPWSETLAHHIVGCHDAAPSFALIRVAVVIVLRSEACTLVTDRSGSQCTRLTADGSPPTHTHVFHTRTHPDAIQPPLCGRP